MRTCELQGCDNPHYAHGICQKHYQRRRYLDANPGTKRNMRGTSLEERLFARLDARGPCWNWTGGKSSFGYGVMKFEGATGYVHRWVWETLVGQVGAGLELDHLCRNKACANPDHLEPVTHAENMRRSNATPAMTSARWADRKAA